MNKKIFLVILLAAFLITGCASKKAEATQAPAVAPGLPQSDLMNKGVEQPALPAAPSAPAARESVATSASGATSGVDRIVIKNANLSIIVDDPVKAMDSINKMADAMKGWVVSSNLYKVQTSAGQEVPQASISIRVPADSLTSAMDQIKALVKDAQTDIRNENVSGQDVTSEYTDLQSRLANLQSAEAQLKEIMASATKTEDVMAVFNQLTQIRSDIEVLKGQIKYYDESASFSAISVDIISAKTIEPLTVAGWQPQGVARDALQALINALKGIVNILIWFVILVLPILVVLYLIIRLVIYVIRKLFPKKKKTTGEQPPAPPATPIVP